MGRGGTDGARCETGSFGRSEKPGRPGRAKALFDGNLCLRRGASHVSHFLDYLLFCYNMEMVRTNAMGSGA